MGDVEEDYPRILLLLFTPVGNPFCLVWAEPSDSLLMNRIWKRLWVVASENRLYKKTVFGILSLFLMTCITGSQLPCAAAALQGGPHGKE